MASWDPDSDALQRIDYALVRNTFVTMFWRRSVLDESIQWMLKHEYDVVEFDTASWRSSFDMFDDVAQRLDFPHSFGRNLNALNDCLSDVASGAYGWRPQATGLVIVLRAFDAFAAVDRGMAQHLLDILASQARSAMLIGNRLICLLQSDDPRLTLDPVGALPVMWNDAEWLNSQRGI